MCILYMFLTNSVVSTLSTYVPRLNMLPWFTCAVVYCNIGFIQSSVLTARTSTAIGGKTSLGRRKGRSAVRSGGSTLPTELVDVQRSATSSLPK